MGKLTPVAKIENVYYNRTRSSIKSAEKIEQEEEDLPLTKEEVQYDKIKYLLYIAREWFGTEECLDEFIGYRVVNKQCDNQIEEKWGDLRNDFLEY